MWYMYMYIYIHPYIYIYIYIYLYIFIFTYTRTHALTHKHICISIYLHVYSHILMNISIPIYTYAYLCFLCVSYICMHTQTHTPTCVCLFVCIHVDIPGIWVHCWRMMIFEVHEFTNWILHYAKYLNALSTTKHQIISAINIYFEWNTWGTAHMDYSSGVLYAKISPEGVRFFLYVHVWAHKRVHVRVCLRVYACTHS